MVQTATHISRLSLAMLRAFAPRIQNSRKGTMASTSHWRQLQRILKFFRKLRHVDSTVQRALV